MTRCGSITKANADTAKGCRVIIENQFGRTNHGHVGQILTYLAGIEGAKTVVWIAESIQADHRAAADWLNNNTTEQFSFFAIEIELWRIGESAPAPRFNVIASPNDWTKAVKVSVPGERESHRVRLAYWASFADYLKEKRSNFQIRRSNKDHWHTFPIGRSGFHLAATISTAQDRIGVELYAPNDVNKAAFRALHEQKEVIEREINAQLEWQELPGKKAMRIVVFKHDVDPADENQYPEIQAWMLAKLQRFRDVFGPRVKALSLPAWSRNGNVDAPDQ